MVKIDSKYFVEVISDSMYDPADRDSLIIGDRLEIDPELTPEDGDFVIVESGADMGVMKLIIRDGKHLLTWVNPARTGAIEVGGDTKIVGVVSMRCRYRLSDERWAAEMEVNHG